MHLAITQPFSLKTSLTMGQAFRWRPLDDGWFSGVLGNHLIHIRQTSDGVEYRAAGPDGETDADLSDLLSSYFRLDDDLEAIYAYLCERDPRMEKLVEDYRGIRMLRQDPWECLVSYMCSAPASIPSITRCVEAIADNFGDPVQLGKEVRSTFPTAGRLATDSTAAQKMATLRLGLKRDHNIILAAQKVYAGKPDLGALSEPGVSCVDAVRTLDAFDGIGHKIASCVAMMSLDKIDAFPIDRWVLRGLVGCDLATMPDHLRAKVVNNGNLTDRQRYQIAEWAQSHFGPYAGYADQYLFHGIAPHK